MKPYELSALPKDWNATNVGEDRRYDRRPSLRSASDRRAVRRLGNRRARAVGRASINKTLNEE